MTKALSLCLLALLSFAHASTRHFHELGEKTYTNVKIEDIDSPDHAIPDVFVITLRTLEPQDVFRDDFVVDKNDKKLLGQLAHAMVAHRKLKLATVTVSVEVTNVNGFTMPPMKYQKIVSAQFIP